MISVEFKWWLKADWRLKAAELFASIEGMEELTSLLFEIALNAKRRGYRTRFKC